MYTRRLAGSGCHSASASMVRGMVPPVTSTFSPSPCACSICSIASVGSARLSTPTGTMRSRYGANSSATIVLYARSAMLLSSGSAMSRPNVSPTLGNTIARSMPQSSRLS